MRACGCGWRYRYHGSRKSTHLPDTDSRSGRTLCAFLTLSGCDLLSTALPQGYANDLVSYADPRWEDRVRITDSQFFGLAVENSGPSPRLFVIGREAVTEYDSELKLVRRYVPENLPYIDAYTDGHGPEKWDAQVMGTSPPVVRLYGAWSGAAIYLFDSGDTALVKRFYSGEKLYSIMLNTPNFDQAQDDFSYDGTTLSWSQSSPVANASAYFFDTASDQIHVLSRLAAIPTDTSHTAYTMNVQVFQQAAGGAAIDTTMSFTTPPVENWLAFDRLTVRGTRVIVTFANSGGELESYESLSLLYDRFGTGQPLASFRSSGGVIESMADSFYVLASNQEGVAWLHRLRWLP